MAKKNKIVDGMFRFFSEGGREHSPRALTFKHFSPEEIVKILELVSGRDAHDIVAYANTCRVSSKQITVDDVRQVVNMMKVKEVQES